MRFFHKSFLLRRRIDKNILGLAALTMSLRIGIGPLILFIYSCIGIYLAADRRKLHRFYAPWFFALITAYMIWSLGLMAFRGELAMDNRQIGYVLLLWLFSFAGFGMVLVRDPLRPFVIGARLGVLGCALAALSFDYYVGGRIGVGGNAAVFAFTVAITAISATIPLKNPPAFLPNGIYYLLIGTGVVFSTQTRAIMVTLPIFIVVEIIVALRKLSSGKLRSGIAALLVVCLGALVSAGPVSTVLSERFSGMIHYYQTGDSSEWQDKISADTRAQMWAGAAKVISEDPLTGVGPTQKMPAVRTALSDQANLLDGYIHVHNAVLDELLTNGLVGLVLLLSAIGCGMAFIWRNNADWGIRRGLIYFVITIAGYAMLHNPLLHEMSIAAVMFFFSTLYAVTRRQIAQLSDDISIINGNIPAHPIAAKELIVSS